MVIRLAAAIAVVSASTLSAQDVSGRPQQWGTSGDSIHTLQAFAFDSENGDGAELRRSPAGGRYCTSLCGLIAPVTIPSGVSIRELELEACDFSPFAGMSVELLRNGILETINELLAVSVTGGPATPGCAFFTATVAANHTVDNLNSAYMVRVFMDGVDASTRFQAVRLYYRLQVSPAPATATFSDVPVGSPIHRFVEALAASGITAGCGGGNFCPNAPLTRGQMAVFLATALGLHFPN